MPIGGLAMAAGVSVETIRYYQRKGLLAVPDRSRGEIRRYRPADLGRVRFVKAAQRLGFSLNDIAELVRLGDEADCATARAIAEHKLSDVRARLEELHRMESALRDLVAGCSATRPAAECPLIAALQSAAESR